MLLIRLCFAVLAALIFPASALADLRSPSLGDVSTLSDMPLSRTYPPATASDGTTTHVAYLEQRGGVMVNRISAAGTEVGMPTQLSQRGTVATDYPVVAVSGENVYVAWIEASYQVSEIHAVVATSRDGGRNFSLPRMAGRPTGHGAWDLRLAADGENVFLSWIDNRDRVWTSGSRDGGSTFPCQALVLPAGDEVDGGGDYALAVDGDAVIWTWAGSDGDIWVRRSADAGRTLEPPFKASDTAPYTSAGSPSIVADAGNVAIAYSKETRVARPNGTGTDFGWDPVVYSSQDSGRSWSESVVGTAGNRCWGDYCQAPYGLAISGDDVYVGWRGQGSMWLGHSRDGGHSFDDATQLGPYAYTWHTQQMPHVAAHGDTVVATWHTAPHAGQFDMDPIAAFSSDRGVSFALRTVNDRPGQDLLPVASAWGPDPQGAGFSWWSMDRTLLEGDTHVRFVPLSAAEPDIEIIDVRPLQAANDAARLAAGRPTTIRTLVRSHAPQRLRVPLSVALAYDEDGERVERTVSEEVLLRPGLNVLQLLAEEPVKVGAGRITAKVTVDPEIPDSDPNNNVGEGSRAVVQPRPLKVLFVPVAADDELFPGCADVRGVADGTLKYLKASWPLDPEHVSVVTDCTTRLVHGAGLTEAGLMGPGGLMSRIDRQKVAGLGIDKVVGVVPQGWFSRQLIDGFEEAVGIAPIGSTLDAAIVERQNTGGWVVAHELAHNLGWTEAEDNHLNDEPAPGYWISERRDIPSRTLDFMQFSTGGASVTDPAGRWLSKQTWDFLTTTLSTGVIEGLAASQAEERVLSLTGSVANSGAVTVDKLWELDGAPEATADGPLTLEQLGADGGVLHAQKFGASNELGPIGNDQATRDTHIETEIAAFSLRVPVKPAAKTVRIRRGEEVVFERARSGAAPAVEVKTPEDIGIGGDLKLEWAAGDADGDALTHFVSLSTDGGTTWRPLGEPLTGSTLTVKAIAALGGGDVRVRVTTSDGWNTVSGESGSFAIGGTLTDGRIVFDADGIFTADMNGGDVKRIAPNGYYPRWSPDGRRVSFQHNGVGIVNGDGTGERSLGGPGWLRPVWHADGERVIARKPGENGLIDLETGTVAPFGRNGTEYCGFSRDGTQLLGTGSTYQYTFAFFSFDGSEPREIGRSVRGYDCLSLSPDGRRGVAARVTSDRDSVIDVIVYDLETGAERNLTNHQFGGYNEHPTWSPTGDWIVWGSNRDRGGATGFGSTDLWKIRPDGTGATKILDGAPAQDSFRRPDIQPLRGTDPDPEPTLEELEPEADAGGPYTVVEGAEVTVSAAGSKPGEDGAAIASTAWDLDGDGVYEADGVSVGARFPDEGTYSVGVLVTDVKGRFSTAVASVVVTNAAPVIADAVVGDGDPAQFSAKVVDPGGTDELTAQVYWDGSDVAQTVPVIASGSGHVVMANKPGAVATARVVVTDGDGGRAEASALRVLAPSNGAPGADDGSASVVAGESVDIDLPARDPEGERLTYEIVDAPEHGTLSMREPSSAPDAPDVTFVATGDYTGADRFTYRVSDGAGSSRVATVAVDVKPAPDTPVDPQPEIRPAEPEVPEAPRAVLKGSKPVDQRAVEKATAELRVAAEAAIVSRYVTLPSARKCVSRRTFVIRVAKKDARTITVHVNGKRVKVARGKATVDLRGLPKGRFKVKIAVTLQDGKVARSTRQYRTCTPKKQTKKGGRA